SFAPLATSFNWPTGVATVLYAYDMSGLLHTRANVPVAVIARRSRRPRRARGFMRRSLRLRRLLRTRLLAPELPRRPAHWRGGPNSPLSASPDAALAKAISKRPCATAWA